MKWILLAGVCLSVAAPPVAAQVVRVSVSTAGVEGNSISWNPSISADGRIVAFESVASNLVEGDTNGQPDIFVRDRDTDADGIFDEPGAVSTVRVNVGPHGQQTTYGSYRAVVSANGRYVFWGSFDASIAPFPGAFDYSLFRMDRTLGTVLRVGSGLFYQTTAAVSADGDVLVYQGGVSPGVGLTMRVTSTGALIPVPAPYVPPAAPGEPQPQLHYASPTISADGTTIAYVTGERTVDPVASDFRAWQFNRVSGVTTELSADDPRAIAITASGAATVLRYPTSIARRVTATGALTPILPAPTRTPRIRPIISPSGRYAVTESALLHDHDLGLTTPLGFAIGGQLDGCLTATGCMPWGAISGDDRYLAVASATSTLVPGDTNAADDVFVIDLRDQLDADDDTMDDRWETLFGVTDANADPDDDGLTNAQEEDAGTHPNGQVRRFLAEGATGTFFQTTIALANPSPTLAAAAVLAFDKGDGTRVHLPIAVPAGRSAVVDVGAVAGVEASDVSTTVESDRLLGVERSMRWGTPTGTFYASHAETATAAPSTTWFLAEGSTVLGFDLFYLLHNPQASATNATVRFLLPSGQVVTRTYALAPGSRSTVWVNAVQGLDETDVSGDISAAAPIVVERAMYRSNAARPFGLGHGAMGVTAPATAWFLAEGATGAFFDLYVLIANPGDDAAVVRAAYARSDGSVVTESYFVAAHSRYSVYVDAIPGLDASAVATTLTSTNGVPIVAERAMYWPGGYFDYYEGHSSAGSTTTALSWVVSGAESGGANAAQTFVLIANTENRAGEATITLLPDVASTAPPPPPAPFVMFLPANSRTTVPVSVDGRYGVRVTSTGASPVQLVVESAVYRSTGGVTWSSGSNALAMPLP